MLLRQQVVEQAEDALLDLTGVAGAADQHLAPAEVDEDEGAGAGAVARRVRLVLGGVQDGEPGDEGLELGLVRAAEHVVREQVVPRVGRDHAHRQAVARVGAAPHVAHEQVLSLQVLQHLLAEEVVIGGVEGEVDLPPVHVALGPGLADDETVLRRAAGMRRGDGVEGTAVHQDSLAAADGVLHQLHRVQVPEHGAGIADPVPVQPVAARAPELRSGGLGGVQCRSHWSRCLLHGTRPPPARVSGGRRESAYHSIHTAGRQARRREMLSSNASVEVLRW